MGEDEKESGSSLIIEDTGEKVGIQAIEEPEKESEGLKEAPEKKEQKITKCPEDVPGAIFSCLATMTDCERLKLTKEEAQRMSEAITNLFGKYIGGWMWWALVLIVLILGKLSHVWNCLIKKEKKKEKEAPGKEFKEESVEVKDLVEVTLNGRITQIPRSEALAKGLIKQAEA